MKREMTPFHVGASLYVPATHTKLHEVMQGRFSSIVSIIIDFEDAIEEQDLSFASKNLETALLTFTSTKLLIFIRPRSLVHFKALLTMPSINKVDGFVFAKCDTTTMHDYYAHTPQNFWTMPVLESKELFDMTKRIEIREFLLEQSNVLLVRLGGEDLSSYLLLKRNSTQTWYDLLPLRHLFAQIVLEFKPFGLALSAPVMTYYKDQALLEKELAYDISMGFFAKTIIHPSQSEVCKRFYALSKEEADLLQTLETTKEAIVSHNEAMIERAPHQRLVKALRARRELYGVV